MGILMSWSMSVKVMIASLWLQVAMDSIKRHQALSFGTLKHGKSTRFLLTIHTQCIRWNFRQQANILLLCLRIENWLFLMTTLNLSSVMKHMQELSPVFQFHWMRSSLLLAVETKQSESIKFYKKNLSLNISSRLL